VLLFGVYPAPLTEIMHASVDSLLAHVSVSKLPPAETGVALLQAIRP
jgi:NADH-quinone oxidoreductase subunit M